LKFNECEKKWEAKKTTDCNLRSLEYIYSIKTFLLFISTLYPLTFLHMKSSFKTPVAVGLALGIYFGIGLFIFALTARWFGYCRIFVSFMKTFYIWYDASLLGAFAGLLRGFVDAFVGWFIVTRLVEFFQKKMK